MIIFGFGGFNMSFQMGFNRRFWHHKLSILSVMANMLSSDVKVWAGQLDSNCRNVSKQNAVKLIFMPGRWLCGVSGGGGGTSSGGSVQYLHILHSTSIYIPLCIVLIEALTGTSSLHLSCNWKHMITVPLYKTAVASIKHSEKNLNPKFPEKHQFSLDWHTAVN